MKMAVLSPALERERVCGNALEFLTKRENISAHNCRRKLDCDHTGIICGYSYRFERTNFVNILNGLGPPCFSVNFVVAWFRLKVVSEASLIR